MTRFAIATTGVLLAAQVCLAGGIISTISAGNVGDTLVDSRPGTPFELDYTFTGWDFSQKELLSMYFHIQLHPSYSYSNLVVELEDTGLTLSMPSDPNYYGTQLYGYYDLAYPELGQGDIPFVEMSSLLKEELADGTLTGRFYIEGGGPFTPEPGGEYWSFGASGMFVDVPEPATMAILLGGAGLLLRRHKR